MIKRGPQGETVYVNQFFTQRPGATGTKHIYAGTSRIASKLVRQDTPNSNPSGNTPFEKDLYFFHPDHIGSTNYVTDLNGKLYEHLEYFPFGEAWVEENSNQQRTPFLFTAKELDEETGLYYYGARYYDPRTSVWQSADPILTKYLTTGNKERDKNLPGMGGIYNSFNLGMYSYSHLNPVKFTDPDGRTTVITVTDRIVAIVNVRISTTPGNNQTVAVPLYRVYVTNTDTGASREYAFTRDATKGGVRERGNYGTDHEAPPGLHMATLRTRNDNSVRLQLYDPNISQNPTGAPANVANPENPNTPRVALQFHGLGCSEGCLMSRSAADFTGFVTASQQSDIQAGRNSDIFVYIQDRNSFGSKIRNAIMDVVDRLFGNTPVKDPAQQ